MPARPTTVAAAATLAAAAAVMPARLAPPGAFTNGGSPL